jgi:capreomycidine synthase
MTLARISPSSLECWLRTRYFTAEIDISSSGVETYSLGALRRVIDLPFAELDAVAFRDSPSLGSDPLRRAIARRFASDPENVMVTHGSTEGLLLAFTTLVRPGDEVIVPRPGYQSLYSIAESIGATLRAWELDPEQGFQPDLNRLRELLSNRTRAVVVNFPHNPTGITLGSSAYTSLLEIVATSGSFLLWDGAFAELVYGSPSLPDPGGRHGRFLSFGTLSKAYGLPGLRVGWCIGPSEVLERMVELRDYVTLNTSPLTECIATRVLERGDDLVGPRLAQARRNRELLGQWAAQNAEQVEIRLPDGGVSAFPRFRHYPSMDQICAELASVHGVLVVPGGCFGHADRIRIGIGGPTAELAEGLRVVADVMSRREG